MSYRWEIHYQNKNSFVLCIRLLGRNYLYNKDYTTAMTKSCSLMVQNVSWVAVFFQ